MLKRTLKDSIDLLQRPDAQAYLTETTKFLLGSMGAIISGNKKDKAV